MHVCRCKFEHPWDKLPVVHFNGMGLPLRQGKHLATCTTSGCQVILATHAMASASLASLLVFLALHVQTMHIQTGTNRLRLQ